MRIDQRHVGLVLILGMAVAASGCGSQQNQDSVSVSQTNGIAINEFSATPSEVFSGQQANLKLVLQNKGGGTAKDVRAKLYNAPITGGEDKGWKLVNGNKAVDMKDMRPPNPDTNQPSIPQRHVWTLEAPQEASGMKTPYDFKTRVYYQYETTATSQVTVMSDEAFRNSDMGTSTPETDNTGGPIQMEVRTRTPIVFFGSGGDSSQETTQFCVLVKNDGSGTAFSPSAYDGGEYNPTQEDLGKLKLKVESRGSGVSFENNQKTVYLGTQGTCFDMTADFVSSSDIQKTIPVSITADYGYFKGDQTRLTVKGQPS